ncbi:MAG TPA: hypothetical protein VEH56_04195 [Candidatus Saccharimonadales bacterium]|nr:hypothetical protein [Candidatus Saccharimonadales bacterium]
MKHRVVALISTALCFLAVSVAFANYYGQIFQPSPILNPNMKFWTVDPNTNSTVPYLWQIDEIRGPSDNASVFQAAIASRPGVSLSVFRSNENESSVWTTVHLRQDLHGQALDAMFNSTVSLWVFPTFTYWYNQRYKNPENVFGIEINDGSNLVWYVFADDQNQVYQFPHHRIIVIQTPLNVWSYRSVDIAHEYTQAGWKKPDSLSFILILGTTNIHPGNWVGYFSGLNVETPLERMSTLSALNMGTLVASNVLIIGILATAGILMWKRERDGYVN